MTMESPDIIKQEGNRSYVETVDENDHGDHKFSLDILHKSESHEKMESGESTLRNIAHMNSFLGISEDCGSSCKGLNELGGQEKDGGINCQTSEANSSQVSHGEKFHDGKQFENSNEKWKDERAEEEIVPAPLSSVDKSNRSQENIVDEITVKCAKKSNGLEDIPNDNSSTQSEEDSAMKVKENACVINIDPELNDIRECLRKREAASATLKEPCMRKKDVEEISFQQDVVSYGERTRFSTRIKKNAPMTIPEGFGVFRQSLKDPEFLSCISPSEFCLPSEIRLYRHRSIVTAPSNPKKARITKTPAENTKSGQRHITNLKSKSFPSSSNQPSKKIKSQEKPTKLQSTRNAKSVRRAKKILSNRKTNVSVPRRSLRQKMRAMNIKNIIKRKVISSYTTRQSVFENQKASEQKNMIEKEKPDDEKRYCGNSEDVTEKKVKSPETVNDKYKHLSATTLAHLQRLWQQQRSKKRTPRPSKFTRKKHEYMSRIQVHQREGYVRRFRFDSPSNEKRAAVERTVKNLRETKLKRTVGPTPVSSNDSCEMEHSPTSSTGNLQILRGQSQRPTKSNFKRKGAFVTLQSRERIQDPEYEPQSCEESDSELSDSSATASASPNQSRVGSPEIEIDVDLSQASEAVQQDEVISEMAENGGTPMGNVQARKLPIFRKLPNPSSEPVATFYYNPEATMLRRCSKYHSCCQLSAAAATVTKADSCTQWEDPSLVYELLNLKTLPRPQPQHQENGVTLPTYSMVRKRDGKYRIKSRSVSSAPHFSTTLTAFQNVKTKTKKKTGQRQTPRSRKSVISNSNSNAQRSSEFTSTAAVPNARIPSHPMATSASVPYNQYALDMPKFNRATNKHQNIPPQYTVSNPSTPSISGMQLVQGMSASNVDSLTQACTSSVSNATSHSDKVTRIPVANYTGMPLSSYSVLGNMKVSIAAPTSAAFAFVNSYIAKPVATGGVHPVETPKVQTSHTLENPHLQKSTSLPSVDLEDGRSHFLFKDGVLWQQIFNKGKNVWAKVDKDLYSLVGAPSRTTTRVELKSKKSQKAPDVVFEVPYGLLEAP